MISPQQQQEQTAQPAVRFTNVRFSYDGTHQALDGISLTVNQGQFVCILGGNGSGKSTLAKHINALLVPDEGSVEVLGLNTSDPANTFTVRSTAGMVFQNPDDQIVASVIENDVAFGPENLGVPANELRQRVTEALEQVGLQGFQKKQTETLSGGQKQRVALAGVLAMQPRILVLDEASAMLDPRGRVGLLRVCRQLNEAGLAIVLITHFMEEAALADRVIVLDNGTVALDGPPSHVFLQAERLSSLALDVPFATQLSMQLRAQGVPVGMHAASKSLENELLQLLDADTTNNYSANTLTGVGEAQQDAGVQPAGAGANAEPAGADAQDAGAQPSASGEADAHPVIEFCDVRYTYEAVSQKQRRRSAVATDDHLADWGRSPGEYWALKDITFAVNRGEFFGIAGHTGSGKSTLIQLANGLLKPTAGNVRVEGHDLSRKSAAAARHNVGVVFQYPEHQLFAATVFDDVAFGPRNLGLSSDEVEQAVRDAMRMVHLDFEELRDRSPFALSGGQQRRVAFAGVLAMRPHTLVLDEPVAGLDPRAKARFQQLLVELHEQQGLTVVVVSHNMDDLAALCDRVLVLNEGRLFALGQPAHIFADEQKLKGVGLGVPQSVHLANQLAAAGVHLPLGPAPSNDELASALVARYQAQQER